MICKFFRNILKNTIQERNKVLIVFDDMITGQISNKKLNPIVFHNHILGYQKKLDFF